MIVDRDLGTYHDKEVGVELSEMFLSLTADGEKTVSHQKEKIFYSLDGDGPIVFAEQRSIHDKKETVYTAVRSDKGLTITTTGAEVRTGDVVKREVPLPKATLEQSRQLMRWLEGIP